MTEDLRALIEHVRCLTDPHGTRTYWEERLRAAVVHLTDVVAARLSTVGEDEDKTAVYDATSRLANIASHAQAAGQTLTSVKVSDIQLILKSLASTNDALCIALDDAKPTVSREDKDEVPAGHVAVPVEKIELLKEARDDTSLSGGAFRALVAALLWPPTPTADDIEWGRTEAERIARRAAAEGTG